MQRAVSAAQLNRRAFCDRLRASSRCGGMAKSRPPRLQKLGANGILNPPQRFLPANHLQY